MFFKKTVLKNFAKFTAKHLCGSTGLNEVAVQKQSSSGVLKKGVLRNFAEFTGKHLNHKKFFEISKNTFFTEHLWWLLLAVLQLATLLNKETQVQGLYPGALNRGID